MLFGKFSTSQNMARRILCLLLIVSIAWAADEDGCYVPSVQKVVPVGAEVTPPGDCLIIKCERKGVISALTCPEEASNDLNCKKIFPDPTHLSYPKCCPYFECE